MRATPAFLADVRRHALQRHHRASASFFSDLRLFRVGDVHDYAALQHLGQADFHAPLIRTLAPVAAAVYFFRVHLASPLDLGISRRLLLRQIRSPRRNHHKSRSPSCQNFTGPIANLAGHE